MSILVADIETDSLDATVVHALGVQDLDTGDYQDYVGDAIQEAGIPRLLGADLSFWHNGDCFDIPVIERLCGVRFDMARVIDTLRLSRLLCPEREQHGLESWGKTFGLPKGDFKDFAAGPTPEMLLYMRRDVELTARIVQHLMPMIAEQVDAFDLEQEVSRIIMEQHRNGMRLDEPRARSLLATFNKEIDALRETLAEAFPARPKRSRKTTVGRRDTDEVPKGGIYTPLAWDTLNPTSRPQMIKRFVEQGWVPTVMTDSDNVSLNDAVLESMSGQFPIAADVARLYDLSKQASQIENWLGYIREGRIHGIVSTCGARTGRMTHSKPNTANVDKREVLRSLWVASPGLVLVDCDAEGLEARGLAHYLADRDGGKLALMVDQGDKDKGTDVHTSNQKALSLYYRDSAKTFLYALIYGSGADLLGEIIYGDAVKAGRAGNMGKINLRDLGIQGKRALMKNIEGLEDLDAELKQRYYQDGHLIGLDGRKIVPAADYTCLNTMIQSAGAIIMKRALVIFDKSCRNAGITPRYTANVHDEWMVEVEEVIAPMIGGMAEDAIHQAGIHYGLRCPLRGASKVGANWYEVH